MSMLLMVKAMSIKIGNPARKLVLLKLADNANDKGECFPSYQHIADHCEVSRKTAISHINALCELGLVKKLYRKGEKGNSSNVYILNLDGVNISPGGVNNSLGSENTTPPPSVNTSPWWCKNYTQNQSVNQSLFEPVNEPVGDKSPRAKKSSPKFDPMTVKPDNLTHEVWQTWVNYRTRKKSMLPESWAAQAKMLSEHWNPTAVINQSIQNGWTGLFPEKIQANQSSNTQAERVKNAIASFNPDNFVGVFE